MMSIEERFQEIEASLAKVVKVVRELKFELKRNMGAPLVSPEEYTALMWELDGWPDITKAVHKNYEITSLDQLPRSELQTVRNKIKDIKKTYETYVDPQR
jgi:hypothetical protein